MKEQRQIPMPKGLSLAPLSHHRGLLCAICVTASLLFPAAHAEAERLVAPGHEVVVSFPRSQAMRGRARSVDLLAVPQHLELAHVRGNYSVGVATTAADATLQSREPVPVNDAKIAAVCDSLREANPGAQFFCEPNILFRTTATPDDRRYPSQYSLQRIAAPMAWDQTTGSSNVIVAVIDTGVDYDHVDLRANIHVNSGEIRGNFVDDDGNGYVDDYYGYDFVNLDGAPRDDNAHGTHCAGIVGARGNNGRGVVGANWQVGILPVKVADASGTAALSDLAAGIEYAVDRGASVLSLSLTAQDSPDALDNAINYAKNQDVLVVAAAGNESENNDVVPSYPASSASPNVMSVAATNSRDLLAGFSNFGATSVDLAAPGVDILSTVPGNQYLSFDGTSMATPLVAGVAALVKAANGALSYAQIKSILMSSVDQSDQLAGRVVSGGRLNAAGSVYMSLGLPIPTPTPEAEENRITISVERNRRRIYLSGKLLSSVGSPVVGERVRLFCDQRQVASKLTDADGYFEFVRPRPLVPTRCHVKDSHGTRSPVRTIR